MTKFTKSKLIKPKKSDLPNAKANSETDFVIFGAKKAFIHLQKAFTKVLILRHFDPGRHIKIETDLSRYIIDGVLSQITLNNLNQFFSNHITHKNLDPIFSKSEIG